RLVHKVLIMLRIRGNCILKNRRKPSYRRTNSYLSTCFTWELYTWGCKESFISSVSTWVSMYIIQ
uniref:Uncharacterized protein n=1 Tax=Aegilops tauschii subsp. strangulata TaxID=200361 RepID=A0A453L319_AEGTS